jgi:hypothetical protein
MKALFGLIFAVFMMASAWRMHSKAGQPGWVGIIPGLNILGLLKMAGKPYWWALLYFVPVLDVLVHLIVMVNVARSFGKSALFGVGLMIPPITFVALPMIGFGSARYLGPARD